MISITNSNLSSRYTSISFTRSTIIDSNNNGLLSLSRLLQKCSAPNLQVPKTLGAVTLRSVTSNDMNGIASYTISSKKLNN